MERRELTAWLGPAAADLTDDHIDRLHHEAGKINDRWPDPDDQYRRDAALSAAVQYLLGDITLEGAARALLLTRQAELEASAAAQQLAAMAIADGETEAGAARRAGIDRMTLRKVMGKK